MRIDVSEPPHPRRALHRPTRRSVGRAVIAVELVVLTVLAALWQGPSLGDPRDGPTPAPASLAAATTTVRTVTNATTTSLVSTSAVPTTAASPVDGPTTGEPATVLDEVVDASSTVTAAPASTRADQAAPRPQPPDPAPADSAPATTPPTTPPTSVEPPSSSDPTTTPVTSVAPPLDPTPVATPPPGTSPPPETTPPTDPPTTSPPTTTDHRTLCAQLESKKQAIEAEMKRVEKAYADDPATRDRLKDQLEDQKRAVEQQRKEAHC